MTLDWGQYTGTQCFITMLSPLYCLLFTKQLWVLLLYLDLLVPTRSVLPFQAIIFLYFRRCSFVYYHLVSMYNIIYGPLSYPLRFLQIV